MTGDGLVKVADFGLARARAKLEAQAAGVAGQSTLASWGGMTPAYCSPEQAQGHPLSRKTDVWSWGVSVLEMFTGRVTWSCGTEAPEALTAYLQGSTDNELPAMPNEVAEVLQKCFRNNTAERWANMADAAEAMQRAYRQALGKDYPRPTPSAPPGPTRGTGVPTAGGVQGDNPREWLVEAFKAIGRSPAEAEAALLARDGSPRARAIAPLAAYEEALGIIARLIAEGRKDLENLLAAGFIKKAFAHKSTGNVPGAIALHQRAIAIYERLVEQEGRRELAGDLARACENKAVSLSLLRDNRAAVELFGRAIDLYQEQFEDVGHEELANDLARACTNKGVALHALGDDHAAVELYDRAISIRQRLAEQEGLWEPAGDLARSYVNKANAVSTLGDNDAAADLLGRAVAIYERLVERRGGGNWRMTWPDPA